MFETTQRVINLDTVPPHHSEAKAYFEQYYDKNKVDIPHGRYVQIKTDSIYTYMYDIDERISEVKDINGNDFLEFFLA